MQDWSRRELIVGSLAGLASIALPVHAQAAVRLPGHRHLLTRRLSRGLSDGKQIEVTREWLVQFKQQGRGYAILGHQINVAVEAPVRVAALADIERARSTDAKFPILLDQGGLIVAAGEAKSEADVAKAVSIAEQILADSSLSELEKREAKANLHQFASGRRSQLEHLPRDLFFPRGSGFSETRKVSLPDGTVGEFHVEYASEAQADSGLLKQAERKITTLIGQDKRVSAEHWNLRPD